MSSSREILGYSREILHIAVVLLLILGAGVAAADTIGAGVGAHRANGRRGNSALTALATPAVSFRY